MITLDSLTKYTHEVLKYKESVKPLAFKSYDKFIHIIFDGIGETIYKDNFYDWLSKRRQSKIDNILR